ncbi:MAG: DUF6600 domain-containing protein [Burkholderiales bacterium]
MRHRTLLFFSLLVTFVTPLTAVAEYVDPPSRAGRVSLIEGSVLFYDEQAGWHDASINYPVTSQNSIATRGYSRAEVRVGSTALRIADDSQLDLLGITDNLIDARLVQGSLNMRVRSLASGDAVRISTPQTQAIIRAAGRYRIDADTQTTRVTVLQGSASVSVAGAQDAILYAGTSTVLSNYNNYPRPLETAQSDAFDDWARERDNRYERSRTAQYVSPEMTGYEELGNYGVWRGDATYGNVWMPSYVSTGWAPYQDGRWVNVQPWGWTWVDNAPWGFAPFHYGRWVQVNGFWAWAPGRYHARPVYAPALVAFVGEPGWNASFSFGSAPAIGWFPLGWGEPYRPYYHCSNTYLQRVNIANGGYRHQPGRGDHPYAHSGYTTIVPRDRFTNPIIAANQALSSGIKPPVTRVHPIAPPAPVRSGMSPAPGLDRPRVGIVNRAMGQVAPIIQPAPIGRPPEPQPRNGNPLQRQLMPANPQPGGLNNNVLLQQAGRPLMNQPTVNVQPGVTQRPLMQAAPQAPVNQANRGYQPPGVNQAPPRNPVLRAVEPVARAPQPLMQAAPQQVAQPQVRQPVPQAAPTAAIKETGENHRRQREVGDDNGNERRMMVR